MSDLKQQNFPEPPHERIGWPWTEGGPQLPETMPDGSPWPKISIVTPSFNQAQFIEETIRSVLLQGYPNLEYIVIDGGSLDDSVEIIRKYDLWINYWISEPDKGQADAVNKGWKLATGDIMGWLNSDDRYEADALFYVAKEYIQDQDSKMIFGDCAVINQKSQRIRYHNMSDYSLDRLLSGEQMGQPAVFVTRNVINTIGFLDSELQYALDTEFFLRMWFHYPEKLFVYAPILVASSRDYDETKTRTGLGQITTERRMVLNRMLSSSTRNNQIGKENRKIIGYTYRYEAQMYLRNGKKLKAVISMFRAWTMNPLNYSVRGIRYFLRRVGIYPST